MTKPKIVMVAELSEKVILLQITKFIKMGNSFFFFQQFRLRIKLELLQHFSFLSLYLISISFIFHWRWFTVSCSISCLKQFSLFIYRYNGDNSYLIIYIKYVGFINHINISFPLNFLHLLKLMLQNFSSFLTLNITKHRRRM